MKNLLSLLLVLAFCASAGAATISTKAPVTDSIDDNVEWNGSAKWRSQDNPCPFDTPADIFECFAIS